MKKLSNYDRSDNLAEVKTVYKSKVKPSDRPKITCSGDAYSNLKRVYDPDTLEYTEESLLLLLNRANKVLGWVRISSGGITGTVMDVKVIFAIALQTGASGIILSHNHPSGNLNPSESDKATTKKLVDAGKILDIPVLDHLIITDEGYFSFADEGLI